jgi:hypothetical protein
MNATDKQDLRHIVENLHGELELMEAVRRRWLAEVNTKPHYAKRETELGCLDGIAANLDAAIVELFDLLR